MKHLKKLAALLLVGVLALSLLTACGGSGSTSQDAQAEAAVMAAINEKRSDKLQNDPALCRTANQRIDVAISEKWKLSSDFKLDTYREDGSVGFTLIAKCDYKNTDLAKLIKTYTNINSSYIGTWSKVGVVVRTVDGQTYIAISYALKTSIKT